MRGCVCVCVLVLCSCMFIFDYLLVCVRVRACVPLFGQLPLPVTLLLLLPLQLQAQLLALTDVALGGALVRLQHLGLVQHPQLLQLLLVPRDQLLDLRLQACVCVCLDFPWELTGIYGN